MESLVYTVLGDLSVKNQPRLYGVDRLGVRPVHFRLEELFALTEEDSLLGKNTRYREIASLAYNGDKYGEDITDLVTSDTIPPLYIPIDSIGGTSWTTMPLLALISRANQHSKSTTYGNLNVGSAASFPFILAQKRIIHHHAEPYFHHTISEAPNQLWFRIIAWIISYESQNRKYSAERLKHLQDLLQLELQEGEGKARILAQFQALIDGDIDEFSIGSKEAHSSKLVHGVVMSTSSLERLIQVNTGWSDFTFADAQRRMC